MWKRKHLYYKWYYYLLAAYTMKSTESNIQHSEQVINWFCTIKLNISRSGGWFVCVLCQFHLNYRWNDYFYLWITESIILNTMLYYTKYICIWEWWKITNEQLIVKCSAWVTIANHKKKKRITRIRTHTDRRRHLKRGIYTPIHKYANKITQNERKRSFPDGGNWTR